MNEDYSGILYLMDRFIHCYKQRDITAVLDSFSRTSEPTVMWSMDGHAALIGVDAIREHLHEEFQTPTMTLKRARWINLYRMDNVAWITALPDIMHPSTPVPIHGRFTAILVKEQAGWRIAHLHFFLTPATEHATHGDTAEESTVLMR